VGRREGEWIEGINLPHGRLKTLAALFMDRLGSGGVVGRLGFRVGVSASYRYITSFSKLIHKLRHTSFGIEDLRTSGPESVDHRKSRFRQLYSASLETPAHEELTIRPRLTIVPYSRVHTLYTALTARRHLFDVSLITPQ